MIQFTLEDAPAGWTFSKEPIGWGEDGKGPTPPSFSKALNTTPTSFELLDINNTPNSEGARFPFELWVTDQKEVVHFLRTHKVSALGKALKDYDPTIINQLPDPPGPGQGGEVLELTPVLAVA
jgi:hypothetical protein